MAGHEHSRGQRLRGMSGMAAAGAGWRAAAAGAGRGGLRAGHSALQALTGPWTSWTSRRSAGAPAAAVGRAAAYATQGTPTPTFRPPAVLPLRHPPTSAAAGAGAGGGAPWTFVRWAGHNKWSKIFRDKAVNDQKRSQAFTKVAKEIVAAVKGADQPGQTRLAKGHSSLLLASLRTAAVGCGGWRSAWSGPSHQQRPGGGTAPRQGLQHAQEQRGERHSAGMPPGCPPACVSGHAHLLSCSACSPRRWLCGPSQGLGKTEGDLERIVYEATFPRGGALVIETLTDKRTRTVTLLRTLLHKHG